MNSKLKSPARVEVFTFLPGLLATLGPILVMELWFTYGGKKSHGESGSSNNDGDNHKRNVKCWCGLKAIIRTTKTSKNPGPILLMRDGYGKTKNEDECLANRVEDNQILYFSFVFGHGWLKGGKWVLDCVTQVWFDFVFFYEFVS